MRRDQQHSNSTKQKCREHHVEETDVAKSESGGDGGEHQRAPFPDVLPKERSADPSRDGDKGDRRTRAGHPKGELGFAEERNRQHLQPVKQDGLIDVGRAVEQWHEPASAPDHLVSQLGVVRFVRIKKTEPAKLPEEDDPADDRPAKPPQDPLDLNAVVHRPGHTGQQGL
jgi:hypothetical protein